MIIGAHVIRAGVNRHVIDLMERGFIDHIAMNGACAIHDYELARQRRHHRKRGSIYPVR